MRGADYLELLANALHGPFSEGGDARRPSSFDARPVRISAR
jgi:hypothetical protein